MTPHFRSTLKELRQSSLPSISAIAERAIAWLWHVGETLHQHFTDFMQQTRRHWAQTKSSLDKASSKFNRNFSSFLGTCYFLPHLPEPVSKYLERKAFFAPLRYSSPHLLTDPALVNDPPWTKFIPLEDGSKIESWYYPARDGRPTAIISHGRATNMCQLEPLMAPLRKKGFGVFVYDPPGFGNSTGEASADSFLNAGKKVSQFLAESSELRPVPYEEQALIGHSLGGTATTEIATHLPANRKPLGIFYINCFNNIVDAFTVKRENYMPSESSRIGKILSPNRIKTLLDEEKLPKELKKRFRPDEILQQATHLADTDVYVIHGTADDVIDISLGKRLGAAAVAAKKKAGLSEQAIQSRYHFVAQAGEGHGLKPATCHTVTELLEELCQKTAPKLSHLI